MASIKEYNHKLGSLRNTLKITKTMKMVSASKLRRAQQAQRSAKHYAEHLTELIGRLAASAPDAAHPLLQADPEPSRALMLVLSSDKGLCGGFNNNLIRGVRTWIADEEAHPEELFFSFAGRRGYAYFRNRVQVHEYFEGITQSPTFAAAQRIGEHLVKAFREQDMDEVYVAYNVFHSPLRQVPTFIKLLPIEPREFSADEAEPLPRDYNYEPPQRQLLDDLIPRILDFKIYFALLENAAGEHGARMTAMDNATSNAEKLIDEYTLLRNRARQAAITNELIEIISGAEAL